MIWENLREHVYYMKVIIFAVCLSGILSSAQASTVVHSFFSGQDLMAPTAADKGLRVATQTAGTIPGGVTVTAAGSSQGGYAGGAVTFQNFQGETWTGDGLHNGIGYALHAWNPSSNGNSMSISFDMTNLQNLSIRMDVRSAQAGSGVRSTAFTAIEYSLDGGDTFQTAATGSALNFTISGNSYTAWSFNFTNLDEIEDKSQIQIRFSMANQTSVGGTNTTSLKIDNLQLSAILIPEPGSIALVSLAALLGFRRRR